MMLHTGMMGSGRVRVRLRENGTTGSGTNNRTISNVYLGPASPDRKILVVYATRTNSTTGDRRVTAVNIVVDGVTYTGVQLVGPSSNETSPVAVWEIDVPVGEEGNIVRTTSGSSTATAGEAWHLFSVQGGSVISAARNTTANINVTALPSDVVIRTLGGATGATNLNETTQTLAEWVRAEQGNVSQNAGRLDPVTINGTTNFTGSGGNRSTATVIRST